MTYIKLAVSLISVIIIGYYLANTIRNATTKNHYLNTIRHIRPWMLPASFALAATVGGTATLLLTYGPKWMQWGWWNALGGSGNFLAGNTGETTKTAISIMAVCVTGLIAAFPILAFYEENTFRTDTPTRSTNQRILNALWFGAVHLIMGVPIAIAVAISIAGIAYTYVYLTAFKKTRTVTDEIEEAKSKATYTTAAFHAVTNWTIFAIAATSVLIGIGM